jgi:predicted ester cyclase
MKTLFLCFISLWLTPLAYPQTTAVNKMNELKIYDAFNSGDFDELDKYIARDEVDHAIPEGMTNGLEGTKAMFKNFKSAFPDGMIKILETVLEGDYMMIYSEFTGTNKGDFMGSPPTNKRVKVKSMDLVKFDHQGKAIEHWGQDDQIAMMRQMGLIPMQPSFPQIPLTGLTRSKMMKTTMDQNKKTTNTFFQYFNEGNLDGDVSLLDPDFKLWYNSDEMAYGAGTYKMLGETYLKAFPKPKWSATIQLAEGNKVASFTTFEGLNSGNFMDIPASNKIVMAIGYAIDYYKNGKIEKRVVVNDDLSLMQQIGANPAH